MSMKARMSLPTLPHTARRDKENNNPASANGCSSQRVVWSQKLHTYHLFAGNDDGTSSSSLFSSPSTQHNPTKSILKSHIHSSMFLLPFPADPAPRQLTPEPLDPLVDVNYLTYPVSKIIMNNDDGDSKEVTMGELIEAYNILAARLRASLVNPASSGTNTSTVATAGGDGEEQMTTNTEDAAVDASWPLFQPLRKNRTAFVHAIIRDLGKALVDPSLKFSALAGEDGLETSNIPTSTPTTTTNTVSTPNVLLPSPKNTPKKKKDGMTAS
jgi:hypothetical protein